MNGIKMTKKMLKNNSLINLENYYWMDYKFY